MKLLDRVNIKAENRRMKVETPHNQNETATHPISVFAHYMVLENYKFVPLIHPRVCLSAPQPPPLWQHQQFVL